MNKEEYRIGDRYVNSSDDVYEITSLTDTHIKLMNMTLDGLLSVEYSFGEFEKVGWEKEVVRSKMEPTSASNAQVGTTSRFKYLVNDGNGGFRDANASEIIAIEEGYEEGSGTPVNTIEDLETIN